MFCVWAAFYASSARSSSLHCISTFWRRALSVGRSSPDMSVMMSLMTTVMVEISFFQGLTAYLEGVSMDLMCVCVWIPRYVRP